MSPAVRVLASRVLFWALSQATVTWPPGIPGSPDRPLSVGVRPWLTVTPGLKSRSSVGPPAAPCSPLVSLPFWLLTSVIVIGPKLLPPSEETTVAIRKGLKSGPSGFW